ncbi:MAG: YihY family inner membrane protein [Candidatus Sumerlaeota bacterium]|nr:YihY family inner membrane protein [Candidatus Sumerlaeota bacterium]
MNWFRKTRHFLFHFNPAEITRARKTLFRLARFGWTLGERFFLDRCTQKAAVLTYTSILSLFPLLAALSIFATYYYGSSDTASRNVVRLFEMLVLPTEGPASAPGEGSLQSSKLAEHINEVFGEFRDHLGQLGAIASLGLIVSAILLFRACEQFFNEIWGARAKRPFWRTFSAFASILVSLPALAAATTLASQFFDEKTRLLEAMGTVGPWVKSLTALGGSLGPFILRALALATAYYWIPNTRVRFRSALAGAAVAGLLWILARDSFYVLMNMSLITRSVLSAFGATLIFLVWIYVLWVIVFIGAETAYLTQHMDVALRKLRPGIQTSDPRLVALTLGRIAQAFLENKGGLDFTELRRRTSLLDTDLEVLLEGLIERDLVAVRDDGKLIPGRPLENMRLGEVFALGCHGAEFACGGSASLATGGSASLATGGDEADPLLRAMREMDAVLPDRYADMTLADLLGKQSN